MLIDGFLKKSITFQGRIKSISLPEPEPEKIDPAVQTNAL